MEATLIGDKGRRWMMVKEGAVEKDEGQIKRGVGGDRRKDQGLDSR